MSDIYTIDYTGKRGQALRARRLAFGNYKRMICGRDVSGRGRARMDDVERVSDGPDRAWDFDTANAVPEVRQPRS
jgi:hypothetical protein